MSALERLATALTVTDESPDASVDERAEQLRVYKPHVPLDAARRAVEQVDEMLEAAQQLRRAA